MFESCELEDALRDWSGVDDHQVVAVLLCMLVGVSENSEATRVEKCEVRQVNDDFAVRLAQRVSEGRCRRDVQFAAKAYEHPVLVPLDDDRQLITTVGHRPTSRPAICLLARVVSHNLGWVGGHCRSQTSAWLDAGTSNHTTFSSRDDSAP